jgi:hypothetical protein
MRRTVAGGRGCASPLLVLVVVAMAGLGFSGCGGGGESSSNEQSAQNALGADDTATSSAERRARRAAKLRQERRKRAHERRARKRRVAAKRRAAERRRLAAQRRRDEQRRREERQQAQSSCDPAYKGACLDPSASDYDCAGGSGDGPKYVNGPIEVVGEDRFDLDRDGDGVACES